MIYNRHHHHHILKCLVASIRTQSITASILYLHYRPSIPPQQAQNNPPKLKHPKANLAHYCVPTVPVPGRLRGATVSSTPALGSLSRTPTCQALRSALGQMVGGWLGDSMCHLSSHWHGAASAQACGAQAQPRVCSCLSGKLGSANTHMPSAERHGPTGACLLGG